MEAKPCFVCGTTKVPTRTKRFQVMYYWCIEPICQDCFEVDGGEERDGDWDDPWPPEQGGKHEGD